MTLAAECRMQNGWSDGGGRYSSPYSLDLTLDNAVPPGRPPGSVGSVEAKEVKPGQRTVDRGQWVVGSGQWASSERSFQAIDMLACCLWPSCPVAYSPPHRCTHPQPNLACQLANLVYVDTVPPAPLLMPYIYNPTGDLHIRIQHSKPFFLFHHLQQLISCNSIETTPQTHANYRSTCIK